jgi:DNA-binding transcriptional ArsR family regulator
MQTSRPAQPPALEAVLAIGQALADPSRLRALAALRGRELCVCQIVELLDLAPSTVSRHMSVLRQAGLVHARKEGRWVWYRRAQAEAESQRREFFAWLDHSLEGCPQLELDQRQLQQEILSCTPEELCRRQAED